MRKKNELPFLKALVERTSRQENLIPFLSAEKGEEVTKEESRIVDFTSLLSPTDWMKEIHYSWFENVLKSAPKHLQSAAASFLTKTQETGLAKLLEIHPKSPPSRFAGVFFIHFLKQQMMGKEILPREMVPDSDMNTLLDLKKNELLHLIDFLGIYDLAQDMRQIVNKEVLEKIYASLGKDMLQFLQYSMKQPIKWISPKLNLQNWDGTKTQLMQILHPRGLFRLSWAISGENPHFQWHLFHHLDTGRAKVMENNLKQKFESAPALYFKRQVLDLVKRYKK